MTSRNERPAVELVRRKEATPTTRARSAYLSLRDRIVEGLLAPGVKLNIAQLALELKVSPGAVRESLAMLEADGLVESEPQRGYNVMPISSNDVQMLTQSRIEIEKLCMFDALANGGIEWETAVVAALHRLTRLDGQVDARGRVSRDWTEAHREFHRALASGCRNHWLLKMRDLLFQQSERHRQYSALREKGARNVAEEHREVAEAALRHDKVQLGQLISKHFQLTEALVLEGLQRKKNAA